MAQQYPTTPAGYWTSQLATHTCDACGAVILEGTVHAYYPVVHKRACERCATPVLETLRYAATHHLPVELGYGGTVRVIEPHTFSRSRAGDLLLHAVRLDCREQRTYRVDRVEAATVATLQEVAA